MILNKENFNQIIKEDNIDIETTINIIQKEESDRLKKIQKDRLSKKECYCGDYYNNPEGFQNKLRSLGRTDITDKTTPYCPIRKVSKSYAEENFMKVEDIPKGLFDKSPIDLYLTNDNAEKFIDNLGHRLDIVDDANHLNKALNDYNKGPIKKKEGVQRYKANQLRNELQIKKSIEKGTYKPQCTNEFKLNERGHIRYIKAPSVYDQIVQRSTNDNLLIPNVRPKLIFDNGASLKNKGVSFTRDRFKYHLQSACKEFKNDEGVIILMDFSKYFDNIYHDKLKQELSSIFSIEELNFISVFIDEFNIDISYMEDEDIELLNNIPFNSLAYNEYLNNNPNIKNSLDKSKILERSMGIGNHIAQISGVLYPTKMDNYITKVKSIKYYGRYMDDTYIIVRTKEEAKELLEELKVLTKEEGLFINFKKTRIESIHSWITFLKIKYFVTDTYHIIEKPVSETFKREYRRLGKFHRLYINNKITLDKVIECYKCWRGSYKKFDCGYEIKKLDEYMIELFKLSKNYRF